MVSQKKKKKKQEADDILQKLLLMQTTEMIKCFLQIHLLKPSQYGII